MADIFEYLEIISDGEGDSLRKAAAIAVSRSEALYPFLEKSSNISEFNSRLALVQDKIDGMIQDACEEFNYADTDHISKIVHGQIELLAADVEDGDNYYTRRDELPKAGEHGELSGEPSPKLNPDTAGDEWHTSQEAPEIDSVRHRKELQHPQDRADYVADLEMDHPLVNRVNADIPMQPEFNVGDNTKVFPNKGQARPVASKKKIGNIRDLAYDLKEKASIIFEQEIPDNKKENAIEQLMQDDKYNELSHNIKDAVVEIARDGGKKYGKKKLLR